MDVDFDESIDDAIEERGCNMPRPQTLPASIDLDPYLRRIELLAKSEDWGGCIAVVDDLRREAHAADPSRWSYAERLRASPEQIGVGIRLANTLARIGIHSVTDLLYATREQLENTPQIGPLAIDELRTRLLAVLAGTRDERFVALSWPSDRS